LPASPKQKGPDEREGDEEPPKDVDEPGPLILGDGPESVASYDGEDENDDAGIPHESTGMGSIGHAI